MALYHIHRPQTFADILGQDHIKQTLREQVKANNVAHAYLFSGPRGVGKTSMARILAKAVTAGIDSTGEVCNNNIAEQITNGQTIDIIEIDAASHTGVDNVREQIIENAQFRPTLLSKKIFIIDEVHMLSTSAFNALLKVLEEPPEYVIFILATTEPQKIPATIISRCQRFDFRPIPYEVLLAHLQMIATSLHITVDGDVLSRIVHKSDGCARDAVSLLDQIMSIGKKIISLEDVHMILPLSDTARIHSFIQALIDIDETTALTHIQNECENGTQMRQFGTDCISYLRYLMIAKTGAPIDIIATNISPHAQAELLALTTKISYEEILILLDACITRTNQIPKASIPQLPLEMLSIWWCHRQDEPSSILPVHTPKSPSPTSHPTPSDTNTSLTPPAQKQTKAPSKKTPGTLTNSWNAIISKVEQTSPSLVFILHMAKIQDETNCSLTLAVSYGFHKDKLMTADARHIIESCIQDITHQDITLDVVVIDQPVEDIPQLVAHTDTDTESSSSHAHIQELASAFGGTIVSS
jgi:DNA polymerase-3 subunit gamma/tau